MPSWIRSDLSKIIHETSVINELDKWICSHVAVVQQDLNNHRMFSIRMLRAFWLGLNDIQELTHRFQRPVQEVQVFFVDYVALKAGVDKLWSHVEVDLRLGWMGNEMVEWIEAFDFKVVVELFEIEEWILDDNVDEMVFILKLGEVVVFLGSYVGVE